MTGISCSLSKIDIFSIHLNVKEPFCWTIFRKTYLPGIHYFAYECAVIITLLWSSIIIRKLCFHRVAHKHSKKRQRCLSSEDLIKLCNGYLIVEAPISEGSFFAVFSEISYIKKQLPICWAFRKSKLAVINKVKNFPKSISFPKKRTHFYSKVITRNIYAKL